MDQLRLNKMIDQLRTKWAQQQEQIEALKAKEHHQDGLLLRLLESNDETQQEILRLQRQIDHLQTDLRDRKAREASASRPRCGHCGGEGHNVRSCPKRQQCGNCGERGHKQPGCPKLQACSNCGGRGHKRPGCPALQACGHCGRKGHKRPRCPELVGA